MVGRNKIYNGKAVVKLQAPSEWMDEFNKVHNPDYYYGEKKTTKKKTRKRDTVKRHPVFKVSD